MKIMIVDDHAEMRRLLRSMLNDLASEFTECADGTEAVAAFAQHRPDWTIMDITMKGMNGLEATRRIKRQFPDARVLVLTQHDSLKIRRAAREAGASVLSPKTANTTAVRTQRYHESGANITCAVPLPGQFRVQFVSYRSD